MLLRALQGCESASLVSAFFPARADEASPKTLMSQLATSGRQVELSCVVFCFVLCNAQCGQLHLPTAIVGAKGVGYDACMPALPRYRIRHV